MKSRMKGSISGRVAPRGRRVGRTSALARKRRAEAEEVDVDSVQDLTDLEDSEPDMGGEAAAVDDLPTPGLGVSPRSCSMGCHFQGKKGQESLRML